MAADIETFRREAVRMCRSSHTRTNVFTPGAPTHWSPQEVTNPNTELPFSSSEAWDFIAELLEGGCEIEMVELEKPPGKTGYVIKVNLDTEQSDLYVKLQLGKKIIGRSFHLTNRKL